MLLRSRRVSTSSKPVDWLRIRGPPRTIGSRPLTQQQRSYRLVLFYRIWRKGVTAASIKINAWAASIKAAGRILARMLPGETLGRIGSRPDHAASASVSAVTSCNRAFRLPRAPLFFSITRSNSPARRSAQIPRPRANQIASLSPSSPSPAPVCRGFFLTRWRRSICGKASSRARRANSKPPSIWTRAPHRIYPAQPPRALPQSRKDTQQPETFDTDQNPAKNLEF